MVFDLDDERERLVAELQLLGVRPDVLEWIEDPDTDLSPLTGAAAVPFWDDVLRRFDPPPAVREPVFALAIQAYLERWRSEIEQSELFEAAQILAQAARDHLSTRSSAID